MRLLTIAFVCGFLMTTATEARSDDDWASPYLWAGVILLGADVGLAYANARSLSHDEPGLGKGITGLAIGSLTTVMGAESSYPSDQRPLRLPILHQLAQHPPRRLRVNEGDPRALLARSRLLIDQRYALLA